jgi:hypothetical protein
VLGCRVRAGMNSLDDHEGEILFVMILAVFMLTFALRVEITSD